MGSHISQLPDLSGERLQLKGHRVGSCAQALAKTIFVLWVPSTSSVDGEKAVKVIFVLWVPSTSSVNGEKAVKTIFVLWVLQLAVLMARRL